MGKEQNSIFYDEVYKTSEKYLQEAKDISVYYEIWKTAKSYLEENNINEIIDLGCGPGHFASILRDDIKYTGYDFSKVAIDQAIDRNRNKNNVSFIQMDLSNYQNINSSFYTSFEFLEHISFDRDLISSLNTGDLILFSVPNHDSAGHVRFFESKDDIITRYGNILNLEHITTIEHGRVGKKIFMYLGIKK